MDQHFFSEFMKELKVKPIPTRNWKDNNVYLATGEYKYSESLWKRVDKRIYYMWFNYLKLCLNLEEINYSVKKKGLKGEVLSESAVKVNRKIYKGWDLKGLYSMNFKKWYKDPKHKILFTEGGFKPQGGARHHSLVKRYNIFIDYYNGMNRNFYEESDLYREMQVCEDIIEKYQKKRFDQLKINIMSGKFELHDLVKKDVNICGREILSCCQGEFPKSK